MSLFHIKNTPEFLKKIRILIGTLVNFWNCRKVFTERQYPLSETHWVCPDSPQFLDQEVEVAYKVKEKMKPGTLIVRAGLYNP